ncbi:metalloregulator ArsR/SmtB family transcription factor [Actinotignum urinale]|uniref:ArsR/SmtB family transcription factor n=1 Tax=Actinotignum urinale TaxID=190146 RepID=UPI002A7EF60A|nr:metalloregulator ArsR/SmtB family transcription factor [Actinotignum urinale]MDY5128394.1 metalloregulator ArsR/SmtB family transcription factor [Actinotignum urinale]
MSRLRDYEKGTASEVNFGIVHGHVHEHQSVHEHPHDHRGNLAAHYSDPHCPMEESEILRLLELADEWSDIFKLLGDATRLRILLVLHYAGPHALTVTDIAEAVDVRTATASAALRLMEVSGVVKARRHGRQMLYELIGPEIHALLHAIGGIHAIRAKDMAEHEEHNNGRPDDAALYEEPQHPHL